MSTTESRAAPRLLTIGAVCRRLQPEFPDLSISKIRYLEDQKLISPRRTRGGYRLFDEDDVERLETILRLQRDEFLPLHVIRQELSSPSDRRRRRGASEPDRSIDLDELCEQAGVSAEQVRQIEEYGLIERGRYTQADIDITAICAELARYGLEPRKLRTLRNDAASASDAVVQTAPGLFARNPEKRQAAVEHAQSVAELMQDLSQLLFQRALRARLEA
jgi:DNA-binding transcriptional MerR regulator